MATHPSFRWLPLALFAALFCPARIRDASAQDPPCTDGRKDSFYWRDRNDSYDIVIRNGRIVDGTGNPWYAADIGIKDDQIVYIGNLLGVPGRVEIDAAGRIVAPGFIDMLGRSETFLLIDSRATSKLSQGITTEIVGEGFSAAPQNDKTLAALQAFLDRYHLTVDWTTVEGYLHRLETQGTPLNIGVYVGSAQVRRATLGDADRLATRAEIERMREMVEQAMEEGALGVSGTLAFAPNRYSRAGELIAFAKTASSHGGIYATHMRSDGVAEMEALAETVRIGRVSHSPVEILHLKVSGKSRWGRMAELAAQIEGARDSGIDITADVSPYQAAETQLADALPPWVSDGGREKLLSRLADPATRERLKAELRNDHPNWENLYSDSGGSSGVLISSVWEPSLKQFEGKNLGDIAREWKRPAEDALLDLLVADHAQTRAIFFLASEEDLKIGLAQAWTSIGTDAPAMSLDGLTYEPHVHPGAFGAMPRFLGHYVRDEKLMTLEVAIRKITSLPAQREHLENRGILKPGFFADITIFDAARIIDRATYARPDQLSEGVDYVIVNGKVEFDHGRLTGVTAGRPIRGRGWHHTKPKPAN